MSHSKIQNQIKHFAKTGYHKADWKKNKDKRFVKNWRPVFLLNVDYKLNFKISTINSCTKTQKGPS